MKKSQACWWGNRWVRDFEWGRQLGGNDKKFDKMNLKCQWNQGVPASEMRCILSDRSLIHRVPSDVFPSLRDCPDCHYLCSRRSSCCVGPFARSSFVLLSANPFKYYRFYMSKPRKYFLFLGWCILGAEGVLMACYMSKQNLVRAVDREVIKARTNESSESTQIRDEFRTNLEHRDAYYAWSGARYGTGLHIIPHHLG
jgi:hypothetical protein